MRTKEKTQPKSKPQGARKGLKAYLEHPIVSVVALVVIAFTVYGSYGRIFDRKLDGNGDNIYYFTCAKALAEGDGYSTIVGPEVTPQTHFPPGYSLFVSGVMKIWPDDVDAVKRVNGVLLCLALFLFFLIIKRCTGNSFIAFCTTLVCCFQKDILRFSTIMMSEMLYIFLAMLVIYCLLLLKDWQLLDRKVLYPVLLLLALFGINYAFMTRSIGMTLVIAVVMWLGCLFLHRIFLWFRARRKGATLKREHLVFAIQHIAVCLLVVASFLCVRGAWNARQERCGHSGDSYESVFAMKPNGEKMATMEDWKARLKTNIKHGSFI